MVERSTDPGDISTERLLRDAFERHYASLLRLSTLLSRDRHTGEELVQEAFVRSMPYLSRLGDDEVGPYLRRAVVNLTHNRSRRLRLERSRGGRASAVSGDPIQQADDRDLLWRAIRALPRRQRECLVLRYYEDLPERVVAEILGCSVGSVKAHTSRGLEGLRKEIGERYREPSA